MTKQDELFNTVVIEKYEQNKKLGTQRRKFVELRKLHDATMKENLRLKKIIESQKQEIEQLTTLYDELNKKYCKECDKNIELTEQHNRIERWRE